MLTLSIWPLQGAILQVPQFDFELGCNSFGFIRRNDRVLRRKFESLFCTRYVVQNANGVYNRSSFVSLGSGHKRFIGLCSPMRWSLEENHVSNDVDNDSKVRVESGFEEVIRVVSDLGGDGLDKGEVLLSENVGKNVDQESKERNFAGLEGVVSDIVELGGDSVDKGELLLSENVGNNVGRESKERVNSGFEEAIGVVTDLGGTVSEDSKEQVVNVLGETPLSKGVDSYDVVIEDTDKRVLEGEKKLKIDVRGIAKSLHIAKSVEDVEQILKYEARLPLQVLSSIIRSFGREKRLEAALAIVAWLKEKHKENEEFDGPNLFIYNSLLGAVKQSGEFGKLEVVMNDMNEAGFSPNIVTYNTLMGVYLDDGRADEALNLFEEMEQKGLPLSPASYSTAMLAYRKMEDGIGALRLFVDLKQKYMTGGLENCDDEDWETEFPKFKDFTCRVCYQVMRRWLTKDENLSTNVLRLLIQMDKAGIPPTKTEYERLVWACTREEHYMVAKELYNRIREQRLDISLSVCNHIIWLMGKAKKWWAALEVYEDLLEFGPKPNSLSYELIVAHFNVLLSAAKKRGIWKWAVSLLEKMEAKGLKPSSREWNAVLVACSKASETSAAVEIFKKMVGRGEKPTQVSYGALLSALEKGKMYDEAVRVWEHMRKVGIEPNLYSYTIMATVYVGLGKFDLVEYIIQEMISTGNDPTVITFNAIISVCSKNGLGGEAYEWFQRMKGMNLEPNEITYEMLILALAKDGKPRLAYDLYMRVFSEGLTLSYRAYDAVIESSRDYGATIDVSALGPRPPEPKLKVVTGNNLSKPGIVVEGPWRRKPFDKEEFHAEQT